MNTISKIAYNYAGEFSFSRLTVNSHKRMHELSITQSIFSIALEQAKTAKAKEIAKVNLTIGECA
ncbi:hydrogenase/urease maturation nickel metallochaperone HypA [Chloroflexota bacterium]